MPATRIARRDVILRVPKMNADARKASNNTTASTSQLLQDSEGSSSARRSMSPVKKTLLQDSPRSSIVGPNRGNQEDEGEDFKYAIQATSAAEWNSLLIWARRQRGPQWDASTGIWQVDMGSTEYYSFCNDPARSTKLSNAVHTETNTNTEINSKTLDEKRRNSTIDEGESELTNISGYSIEDSPPIGPGNRRSRLAR